MGKARRNRIPRDPVRAQVHGLSHEGRGVAQVDGKTVFVHGALPDEEVTFFYKRRHRRFDEAAVEIVHTPAPKRVEPRCPHFGICGGCSLQHLSPDDQIAFKQGVLLEQFRQFGKVAPEQVLPPLRAGTWGYRRKARLAVKSVPAKGRVLVGFREKYSPYVANMTECHVLDPRVGMKLAELSELVGGLSRPDRVPQIEVSIGDNAVALVFRNLEPWTAADRDALTAFGQAHDMQIYEQPGNESTIAPIWPEDAALHYMAGDSDIRIEFLPSDFTQVNADLNTLMLERTLNLLDPGPEDRILDLFCGLGNFTLPLARRAGRVVGVEGAASLVERARRNAQLNGTDNAVFHVADLAGDVTGLPWLREPFDKVLLDPPRSGAAEVIPRLSTLGARRIVYVSCNPATLARDAGMLVHDHGYRLLSAGVMDMFPHTAHVESIAMFER
ncbi:MAG: 23S rRNA (uracil(1939)-C(5))-methyltransferase RlmD [Aquisalimonadaceae bacterium]